MNKTPNHSLVAPSHSLMMTNHSLKLKESNIRPREIPSPKDSAFIANMRSHKKIFHQLAEFGKILWEPGADSPEGVENDL